MEERQYGNHRAKVVDNKDPKKCGRVLLWIPDIMQEEHIEPTKGLWARPANNPAGGRNSEEDDAHTFMGSSFVPKIGSWVWVFFEAGNVNRPYYFGALDLEHPFEGPSVLPECQTGDYPHKWVIFKSHEGRCIVVSDDPSDERVEITGKKRTINTPPHGDTDSVYLIDGNQTVILLDEMAGREKLLIRTRLGDYIHIDIEEQQLQAYFKNDINIKTDGNFNLKVAKDIKIKTDKNMYTEATLDITRKAGTDIKDSAGAEFHKDSGADMFITSGAEHHTLVSGNINRDGAFISDQGGASQPDTPSESVNPTPPEGNRDT